MLRNAALATRRLLRDMTTVGNRQTWTGCVLNNKAIFLDRQVACLSSCPATQPKLLVVHPNRKSEALLHEALRLAESYAGSDCPHIGVGPAKHFNITPSTYFGPGVVKSIQESCEAQEPAKLFVNVALSPVQQRNLEAAVGLPVLDRVGLIIEIFAQRARTSEARLQVELAALDYRSSRLVRVLNSKTGQRGGFGEDGTTEVVSARERGRSGSSSGGLGGASGGGQSELQLQRQRLTVRRKALQKKLSEVQRTREVQRAARRRAGKPVVAVVGYTNAGKSSLLQALTRTDAGVQDRLFATLDPALRRVHLPSGREAILSDTVGFISDLPHQLVNAFRATLEEVCEADLLLHVLDASSPSVADQRQAVLQVLRDLGISEAKLQNALLEVWNKQDLMQSQSLQSPVADQQHTHGISLDGSAQTGSTPPATPADSPEPSTNEARPDSMQLQSEAYQDSAASAQGAAQQNAVTGEHGVAARQQPGCHASEGQPLTQSVHQHQVGTSNASSQQPNSFSISSDRHGITSPNTEPNGAQSAACQHQHQDQLASDQHHTGQMGDSSVLDAGSNPSQHTGGQHSIPGSAVNGAVQAAGQPTVLFTSATTGRGLPELLHEVERKLSLKWATRELADGTARFGSRLLTHTTVGPPNKQRRPRWRGAGQWESLLTQSLRDQSTDAMNSQRVDVMHGRNMQDIKTWAQQFLKSSGC